MFVLKNPFRVYFYYYLTAGYFRPCLYCKSEAVAFLLDFLSFLKSAHFPYSPAASNGQAQADHLNIKAVLTPGLSR